MTQKAQTIWIVRYGLTKYPLVENKGPYDSPIDPTEGLEHAKCIAARISRDADKPSAVYASPFLRTTETAHLIAQSCGCKVRIEEGLTEWQVPSLLMDENGVRTFPKSTSELSELFSTVDAKYVSINPSDVTVEDSPRFEESEEALLKRCARTIQRLLDISGQTESICIVSHAPCDQGIAFALEGASSPSESSLEPWPLGGITKFKNGKLEFYGDTDHMPGIYKPGIKQWSLPCLDKK